MEQGVLVAVLRVIHARTINYGNVRFHKNYNNLFLRGVSTKINLSENCLEEQVCIDLQIRGILAPEISSSPLAKCSVYILLNNFLPFFLAHTCVFISN